MKHIDKVVQIGYLFFTDSNSQAGRVYDVKGLSPTIVCNDGWHKQRKPLSLMRQIENVVSAGYVWNSRQNGIVLDARGVSHCLTIGQHSGVEPKIRIIYETD